jgi:hypothetical protein
MISIFVEPESVAAARQMSRTIPPTATNAPQNTSGAKPEVCEGKLTDDFWIQAILETLAFEAEPMEITRLVNATVAWGNYTKRRAREMQKVQLFGLVGRMIRMGRLERFLRKYVKIPSSNERYRAYLAKSAVSVELPKASV